MFDDEQFWLAFVEFISLSAGRYVRFLSTSQLLGGLLTAMQIVFHEQINQMLWESGKDVHNTGEDVNGLKYEDNTLEHGAWLLTDDGKFINDHAAQTENIRKVLHEHSPYTRSSAVIQLE